MDNTVHESQEHINLEELKKYISHLKAECELFEKLRAVANWYNKHTRGEIELFYASELSTDLIEMIERSFNADNEHHWVSYFCYELLFGKAWRKGCVTDSDGNDIPLATVEDLYNLLLSNYK